MFSHVQKKKISKQMWNLLCDFVAIADGLNVHAVASCCMSHHIDLREVGLENQWKSCVH